MKFVSLGNELVFWPQWILFGLLSGSLSSHLVQACTYELSYDGMIGTELYKDHRLFTTTGSEKNVPLEICEKLTYAIGSELVYLGHKFQGQKKTDMEIIKDKISESPANCKFKKMFGTSQERTLCVFDFMDENLFMDMRLNLEIKENEDDRLQDFFIASKIDLSVSTSTSTSTSTSNKMARNILMDLIPKIIMLTDHPEEQGSLKPQPYWTIRSRPSSSNECEGLNDKSSLDAIILSNTSADEKKRMGKSGNMEVWKTKTTISGSSSLQMSLFVNDKLRYTTKFAGSAHIEAFAHPVLISHPDPKRIAIISQTPLALANEILKHQSVQHISLYNVKKSEIEFMVKYFPSLNDCGYMDGRKAKCLDAVTVDGDFDKVDDASKSDFDVIFIDVPSDGPESSQFLSIPFIEKVFMALRLEENSSVIINAGSSPSGDIDFDENIGSNDHRASFLRMSTRDEYYGGLELSSIHVYDEVRICMTVLLILLFVSMTLILITTTTTTTTTTIIIINNNKATSCTT